MIYFVLRLSLVTLGSLRTILPLLFYVLAMSLIEVLALNGAKREKAIVLRLVLR